MHEQGYINDIEVYWSPARKTYGGEFPHSSRAAFGGNAGGGHTFESVGYGLTRGAYGSTEHEHIRSDGAAPLRLDEAGAPPASNMLVLVESYSTEGEKSGAQGGLNGYFTIDGEEFNDTSRSRPFNYNGNVVRAYVDGHAIARGPRRYGAVSGWADKVDSSPITEAPHPEELGWSISPFSLPPGEPSAGPYGGGWTFLQHEDYRYHEPWFSDWRSDMNGGIGWYSGLRAELHP